jgi:hypothetical protein
MNYPELVSAVLEENRKVLEAVSTNSVDRLIEEILKAKSVHPVRPRVRDASDPHGNSDVRCL